MCMSIVLVLGLCSVASCDGQTRFVHTVQATVVLVHQDCLLVMG